MVRNEAGLVMTSLSQQIRLPSTVLEVETLAARSALELAIEIGVNKVILEGDCAILIYALQFKSHSFAQFGHLAKDVSTLHPFSKVVVFPMCVGIVTQLLIL